MGWFGKLAAIAFFTGAMFYAAHKLSDYTKPAFEKVDGVVEKMGNEIVKQYERIRENYFTKETTKDISDKLEEGK